MLLGMIPQKRLVLMWKKARSVSRPSSGGRCPALKTRYYIPGCSADDAVVGADVGAGPVGGEALGVGVEGAAPGLERDVGAAEAVVGEGQALGVGAQAVLGLEVRGEVAVVVNARLVHGEELAVRDVGGLGAADGPGGGEAGRQEQEQRGRQTAAVRQQRRPVVVHGEREVRPRVR
jgi:hypothetical protein